MAVAKLQMKHVLVSRNIWKTLRLLIIMTHAIIEKQSDAKTDKAKFCKLCNDDGRTCLIVRGLFMFHISDMFSPSAVCFLENQIEIVLK